jgi:hypothetical protein
MAVAARDDARNRARDFGTGRPYIADHRYSGAWKPWMFRFAQVW